METQKMSSMMRYSDDEVQIGQIRYVGDGSDEYGGKVRKARVVKLLSPIMVPVEGYVYAMRPSYRYLIEWAD
jgi:hypothetical protein